MGSALIVEADPSRKCSCSVIAGLVDGGVRPLALERLDETLGFAIRARTVWTRADVLDSQAAARACEIVGDVAAAVVAEKFADTHAVHREPTHGPFHEPDRRRGRFVGQDLDVCHAAVVIHGDVHELPALADLCPHAGSVAAHHAVSGTHKTSEFLDVNVHELTRPAAYIPIGRLGRAQARQPVESKTRKHRAHGRHRHPQPRRDLRRGHSRATQLLDETLASNGGSTRHSERHR